MMRRKWLIAGCMGIIGILAVTFVLFQGHREKTVIETVIVNDVPTPPFIGESKTIGVKSNYSFEPGPTKPGNSGTPSSEELGGDSVASPLRQEAAGDDSKPSLGIEDDVVKVRREIAEIRENSEIDASEPQKNETIGDLWRAAGLSDAALEQIMAFVPFNPNISLDESDELLANMQAVVDAIDARMRASMADVTLDEARIMVNILKNDPTTTEDEYRYITRELFSNSIQQALIRDRSLSPN